MLKTTLSEIVLSVVVATFLSMPVLAAETEDKRDNRPDDGELVLPRDYQKSDEKKCMTVCEQWGEDCIINPATGSRKCRRVCKSFTEECF